MPMPSREIDAASGGALAASRPSSGFKEVKVEGRRDVICRNEAEAVKDAVDRRVIAHLGRATARLAGVEFSAVGLQEDD